MQTEFPRLVRYTRATPIVGDILKIRASDLGPIGRDRLKCMEDS